MLASQSEPGQTQHCSQERYGLPPTIPCKALGPQPGTVAPADLRAYMSHVGCPNLVAGDSTSSSWPEQRMLLNTLANQYLTVKKKKST